METITALKHGLLYGTLNLRDALIRFKELGDAIGSQHLSCWAQLELIGYPYRSELAAYRLYPCVYNVNLINGKERIYDIPISYELVNADDEDGRWLYHCETVTGIFEGYRLEDGCGSNPVKHLHSKMHELLNGIYGPNIEILAVFEVLTARSFRKIILAAEEIMLDFLLSLERKFGPSPGADVLSLYSDDIDILFAEALERTDRADHLDLPIKYKPLDLEGYEDAIIELFDDCEATDEEIDEMFEILDQERESVMSADNLGIVITEHVKKMCDLYPKFGDKGVKLTKAIVGYYGLDKVAE
ncbi:MAG: hypothetical protein V4721_01410 [Bacteroidota bacterium]